MLFKAPTRAASTLITLAGLEGCFTGPLPTLLRIVERRGSEGALGWDVFSISLARSSGLKLLSAQFWEWRLWCLGVVLLTEPGKDGSFL